MSYPKMTPEILTKIREENHRRAWSTPSPQVVAQCELVDYLLDTIQQAWAVRTRVLMNDDYMRRHLWKMYAAHETAQAREEDT